MIGARFGTAAAVSLVVALVIAACAASGDPRAANASAGGDGASASLASSGAGGASCASGSGGCTPTCLDPHTAIDCNNQTTTCAGTMGCDYTTGTCIDACAAAVKSKESVGCDYYATHMLIPYQDFCFAAFIANTWTTPA